MEKSMSDMGPDGRCTRCGSRIETTGGGCPVCTPSGSVQQKTWDYDTLLSMYLESQREIARLTEQKKKDDLAYKGMEAQALDERREVCRLRDTLARTEAALDTAREGFDTLRRAQFKYNSRWQTRQHCAQYYSNEIDVAFLSGKEENNE